jgi:hypothetical protein
VTEPDDGILNRWSRRKLESDKTAATLDPQPDDPQPDPTLAPKSGQPLEIAEQGEDPGKDPGEDHVPLDLPDIDTLDKESDFTVFMQAGVPEELKNLALRALWRSDPVLANLDGLNDYDEDFGSMLKVGAEFMRKLALEEKKNGPGEGFRPLDEPSDDEPPEPGEAGDAEELIVEAPDEDGMEDGVEIIAAANDEDEKPATDPDPDSSDKQT